MSARRLTWRRLTPGLLTILALAAGATSILAFARVGALHGETYHFDVLAGDAAGIMKGTEVWVAGQKVGVVTGVRFRPPSADTLARVAVRVQLLSRYRDAIRHDSRVSFHAGGTPIGATIVAIGVGTPHAPVVGEGDTIRATPTIDRDSLRDELELVARRLPMLIRDARAAGAGLRRAVVELDSASRDGRPGFDVMTGDIERLRTGRGGGTLPRLIRDDTFLGRARDIVAQAESLVVAAHDTGAPALARNRTRAELRRRLQDTRDALATIEVRLATERGTAGRLARDAALDRELARARAQVDSLLDDLRRNPGRYVRF
ncbi:MAG TPA: MlaD family protein [Gemmatimonadaceae bacterium]